MSSMEYNKGVLSPVDQLYIEFIIIGMPDVDDIEEFKDVSGAHGYILIKDQWYKVEFEVNSGSLEDGFCNLLTDPKSGEISFETYHYNGGGGWEEVVGGYL